MRLAKKKKKIIGRTLALILIGLTSGCDIEIYRTNEGIGLIGPEGGWFLCSDNNDCSGTPLLSELN